MAPNLNIVALYLFERWLSGSPVCRIGSAVWAKLSRIQQNQIALKLSSTSRVECYSL
jgi:hypothetical protein